MRKNGYILSIMLILPLVLMLITGCSKNIKTETRGDAAAEVKVLLTAKKSEYKEALINDLVTKMESQGYYIKITNLNRLKKEKIEDYSALVILGDCEMGNLNLNVAKFLSNLEKSAVSKVILFTTAGSPDEWEPDTEVHAITTASEMNNIPQMSTRILTRIASTTR